MAPLFIEFYCGKGTMSQAFEKNGFDIFKIDWRKRTGTCEPTLKIDILKIRPGEMLKIIDKLYPGKYMPALIAWFSPPCPAFSYNSGKRYFENGKLRPEIAKKSTKHIKKVMRLIDEINPIYWFIENPRGQLRYCKFFVDWIVKKEGMIKQITYSSYGSEIPKPTNLFTNALNFHPRKLSKWGRGAKYQGNFNNMTVCQRQQIPLKLCSKLAEWCKNNIPGSFIMKQIHLNLKSATLS